MLEQLFYELIRLSIGTGDGLCRQPSQKEWAALYSIAKKQSLVGNCFSGVQRLCDNESGVYAGMSEMQYLTWMGMAAKIQQKYDHHKAFIGKLAKFYEKEGLGMMLLKGVGLSLLYPQSQLRQPGDVDIFLFPLDEDTSVPPWKRGDMAVSEKLGLEVTNDSEHHTKFMMDDIMVENHYDFVNTRIRRSSQKLEKEFKALAKDHSKWTEIDGQRVYLPSDALNGLFLLRHTAGHFASEGITMKNVVDWGMFVQSAKDLDWDWLWKAAKEYNMHRFLACLNCICMEQLGINEKVFGDNPYDGELNARVLCEIMQGLDIKPEATTMERVRRWWKHRWKHRICYSDSLLSSFVYSVRANLSGVSIE